jgi:hypothetical protein
MALYRPGHDCPVVISNGLTLKLRVSERKAAVFFYRGKDFSSGT